MQEGEGRGGPHGTADGQARRCSERERAGRSDGVIKKAKEKIVELQRAHDASRAKAEAQQYASPRRSPDAAQHSVPAGGQPWPDRAGYPQGCSGDFDFYGISLPSRLGLAHDRKTIGLPGVSPSGPSCEGIASGAGSMPGSCPSCE